MPLNCQAHSPTRTRIVFAIHLAASAFFGQLLQDSCRIARAEPAGKTRLATEGTQFTVNGTPTFLLGISYYSALGASETAWRQDLEELKRRGFNWIRVWATWAAFGNDVSAVDENGQPREPYLGRLRRLVSECDRLGIVVDVTLSRGNGVTGPARLQSLAAHARAVDTIASSLKPFSNWYLDLANERNIRDRRFVPLAELRALRAHVRKVDPRRLVTASHAGDMSSDDVAQYLNVVGVDFLAPHRPRRPGSPRETAQRIRQLIGWAKQSGRVVPVLCQEPFRRGFDRSRWEPAAEDYVLDLQEAMRAGAAGWCFHNGDQRDRPDGRPRRSFDLREKSLFEQFDAEEHKALTLIRAVR